MKTNLDDICSLVVWLEYLSFSAFFGIYFSDNMPMIKPEWQN
jgi:hypothetical protein